MDYQPGNQQNGPGNGCNPYSNNPYNNNPYNNNNPYGAPMQPAPAIQKGDSMAAAAMILGIISLASLLFLQVYISLFLGGVSIVLAILSKGGAKKMTDKAKTGSVCGAIALTLDALLFSFAIVIVVLINRSPAFREEINRAFDEQYGFTYDEMVDEIYDMLNGEPDYFE